MNRNNKFQIQGKQSYKAIKLMGILNATPDSFSKDGEMNPERLIEKGMQMIEDGADMLDIGGESSRPFADPVPVEEEIRRVLPVIEGLRKQTDIPLSIDTYHWETAERAIDAGADMVNDISGLRSSRMRKIIAEHDVEVVIMHMQGTPETMQKKPRYVDVIGEIKAFFSERIAAAQQAGIAVERIVLDPGIGFGKTLAHNLEILGNIHQFTSLGCPILVGPSRKSFIGAVLGTPVDQRLEGTLAAVAACMTGGVDWIRVHDVKSVSRFSRMLSAIMNVQSHVVME